jgi:hypothetical protein
MHKVAILAGGALFVSTLHTAIAQTGTPPPKVEMKDCVKEYPALGARTKCLQGLITQLNSELEATVGLLTQLSLSTTAGFNNASKQLSDGLEQAKKYTDQQTANAVHVGDPVVLRFQNNLCIVRPDPGDNKVYVVGCAPGAPGNGIAVINVDKPQ